MTTLSPTFSPTRSNGSDETTTENSTAAAAAATETGICTTTSTTTTCDGQFDNDDDDLESGRNRKYRPHQELLVIKTPIGVTLRGKYQLRAAVQMVVFGGLVIGYAVYNSSSLSLSLSLSSLLTSLSGNDDQQIRFLEEQQGDTVEPAILCDDFDSPWWLTLLYIIGILYMFLALAIICDEFFVPALEELSGPRRMNLSMDVAGATLMAAGGSAPELATSLIGTFRQSEIGFGTIVGSAVFNILFVIGMCSLLAKEVLNLTWWPLFRDISYYTIGLVVLAVFVGAVGIGEISLWEACILFAMYFGYILLMWQNKNLYKAITGNDLVYPEEEEENDDISNGNSNNDDGDGDGDGDVESIDNDSDNDDPAPDDDLDNNDFPDAGTAQVGSPVASPVGTSFDSLVDSTDSSFDNPVDSPVYSPVESSVDSPEEDVNQDSVPAAFPPSSSFNNDETSNPTYTTPTYFPTKLKPDTSWDSPTYDLPTPTYETPKPRPTATYVSTDDDPIKNDVLDEDVMDSSQEWGWNDSTVEEMEHDRTVIIALSIIFGVMFFFSIFIAYQLLENPDGCCASLCRISVACVSGVVRCVCYPCRALCGCTGQSHVRHSMISNDDGHFTHDLELS
mmetsp:Transcript_1430/g.1597  ORF Transcript_1430/g.1597 Transcript_1430/m.1597 type:complete len:619 (-) Transcript_1430:1415-3271(-)